MLSRESYNTWTWSSWREHWEWLRSLSSSFQKGSFPTQLWERSKKKAELYLQAAWGEEEQPPSQLPPIKYFTTTLEKSSRFQMHKTGETVHSSAVCPLLPRCPQVARGRAPAQLATAGWAHLGALETLSCLLLKASRESRVLESTLPQIIL